MGLKERNANKAAKMAAKLQPGAELFAKGQNGQIAIEGDWLTIHGNPMFSRGLTVIAPLIEDPSQQVGDSTWGDKRRVLSIPRVMTDRLPVRMYGKTSDFQSAMLRADR